MKRPLRQGQRLFHDAAAEAHFARREPSISDHDARTIEPRLVGQLSPEFVETAVHDRAGERAIGRHALDIQVFDANGLERIGQHRRQLVGHVAPDIGDAAMDARQTGFLLAPVGREPALAGAGGRGPAVVLHPDGQGSEK